MVDLKWLALLFTCTMEVNVHAQGCFRENGIKTRLGIQATTIHGGYELERETAKALTCKAPPQVQYPEVGA